jgi:hypothetical protein
MPDSIPGEMSFLGMLEVAALMAAVGLFMGGEEA